MNLEQYLNQPLEKLLALGFEAFKKDNSINNQVVTLRLNSDYFTKTCKLFQVVLNEDKTIQFMSLFFTSLIDTDFYSVFKKATECQIISQKKIR